MLFTRNMTIVLGLILWLLAFLVAITIHEASHAWMADRLGDPTARLSGRLSLNPLVHYDPIGTTLLLVLVILRAMGIPVFPFGWAKPVAFDPYNLKNPKKDAALISLAGPGSNLVLALILSVIARISLLSFSPIAFLANMLVPFIVLNVALGLFNLIPIHPLDGGKILVGLLPLKEGEEVDLFLSRYGIVLLFMLIFPSIGGNSPFNIIISPVFNFLLNILIPGGVGI
jgi:Zn-dependent protease